MPSRCSCSGAAPWSRGGRRLHSVPSFAARTSEDSPPAFREPSDRSAAERRRPTAFADRPGQLPLEVIAELPEHLVPGGRAPCGSGCARVGHCVPAGLAKRRSGIVWVLVLRPVDYRGLSPALRPSQLPLFSADLGLLSVVWSGRRAELRSRLGVRSSAAPCAYRSRRRPVRCTARPLVVARRVGASARCPI